MSTKELSTELFYSNLHTYIEKGYSFEYRTIYISDVTEEDMSKLIRAFDVMENSSNEPIHIFVSSFGGSVYDGLALFDKIRASKSEVHTYAMGKVMSMGLILFLAGDIRHMQDNATAMAHSVSSGTWGKARNMEVDVNEVKRLNKILINILTQYTKMSTTFWEQEIKHEDKYYDKKTCKKLGII